MRYFFAPLLFCLLLIPTYSSAQNNDSLTVSDKEYRAAVERLVMVSGGRKALETNYPLLMESLKKMCYYVPDEIMKQIEEKFRTIFFDNINELYVPVYKKYYTLEELKAFADFFETPLGKKVAATTPLLTKDLFEAGQEAGKNIIKEVLKELNLDEKESLEK